VQCTSWGIQVTSGIPTVDYYLSSRLVEPDEAQCHYTEKLVLADTLLTYQRPVAPPASPKGRRHFGLDDDKHVYLCAQRLSKLHPDLDPILANILRRDPRAIVVLTAELHGPFITDQLKRRLARSMPDVAGRVLILPFQASAEYLSLIALADVLLDPLYFGGVNSTYDGLSLGQPIVTLPSAFQRGRYTFGCYQKMGVRDCIATSADEYVDIAVRLGTDVRHRTAVVDRIRATRHVLFEDQQSVTEHERIFAMLIEDARRRASPQELGHSP
jgi:predicted O-linked N-acetylglucosamine transferase (SPINDLY family)